MKKTDENLGNRQKSLRRQLKQVSFNVKVASVFVALIIVIGSSVAIVNLNKKTENTGNIDSGTVQQYQVIPQMYGAKGDGVTDDTKAFQEALDNNRSIYVPAGPYLVGDLVMPWGVTITGDSATTTILKAKEGTDAVLQMSSDTQASARLYKLTVECDNKAEFGIRYPEISIGSEKDMTLYNLLLDEVYVYHALNRNISIESNAIEARMFEVRAMYSEGTSCYFRGTDSIFVSCMFAHAQQNGFYIKGANNRISSSKAYLNGTNSDQAGIVVDGDTCLFENIEVQQNYANGMIINGCGNVVRGLLDGNNGYGKTDRLGQLVLEDNSWNNTIDVTVMSWKFFNYPEGKMLPQYGVICRGSNQIYNDIKLNVGGIDLYHEQNLEPRNSLIPFYVEQPSPLNSYECNSEEYFTVEAMPILVKSAYKDYGSETNVSIDDGKISFTIEKVEGTDYAARLVLESDEINALSLRIKKGDTVFVTGKAKGPKNCQIIPQLSYRKAEENRSVGWDESSSLMCRSINYSTFYTKLDDLDFGDSKFKLSFFLQENVSKGHFESGVHVFSVKDLELYIIPKVENELFNTNIQE